MVLAQMVVDSVVVEGRSVRVTAQRYGVSKSWVHELVRRYRQGGEQALVPLSKAPRTNTHAMSPEAEELIVATRKELEGLGADAGAETIRWHLQTGGHSVPSTSSIYRLLKRRESNPGRGLCRPLPKPLGHAATSCKPSRPRWR
jgi:transposase